MPAHPSIAPQLAAHSVPIDDLTPWPANPRRGDLDAMAESLTTNGQFRLAVVQDSTGYIVAGNHMWHAAKQLGWTHIAAVRLDLDDNDAKRILAADNRVGDRGAYDEAALVELLSELAGTDTGLAGTGYDTDDLDDLAEMLAAPDDLNKLEDQHGTWNGPGGRPRGEDGGRDAGADPQWPTVVIACPPPVKERFDTVFDAIPGLPHERLATLLDRAEAA